MSKPDKFKGALWVIVCYIFAFVTAFLTVFFLPDMHLIYGAFLANVVATFTVFVFSMVFRNASFYDPYWSVAPVFTALYWKYGFGYENWQLVEILCFSVIVIWSVRLTLNWYRGWEGLTHEDWRYVDFRNKTGKLFPLVNFSGIHLFPTVMIFLGSLPLVAIFSFADSQLNFLHIAGLLIGISAVLIQFVSDEQMRQHRKEKSQTKSYIQHGLWRYSRHPNYFGEILFWVSIAVFGIASGGMQWWMYSGVVAMIILFWFISIPMMEKRILKKYPTYANEQKSTSRLVLWFRRD